MRTIGDVELLELWERSSGLDPAVRALELAASVDPVTEPRVLADQPLGRREQRLLDLHAALAGPRLEANVSCPRCATELEVVVPTAELVALGAGEEGVHVTEHRDRVVTWRCPSAADLVAVGALDDPAAAEAELLQRCVLAVDRGPEQFDGGTEQSDGGRQPADAGHLDGETRAAVVAAMEEADPLADVRLELECGECGLGFDASLEPSEFAWNEVRDAARRLLWDVDTLARAYGWTERDVLALSPARRAAYVDMAVGGPPVGGRG